VSTPLIVVSSLEKTYATRGRSQVHALAGISVEIAAGEFITIVGQSGCGKTTLLKILAGLLQRSAGNVTLRGQSVDEPSRDIGIVFQDPVLLPWRTVFDNVMLPVEVLGLDRARSRGRAMDLLALVGLTGFEDKYPHELSGGMRQRVSLCRALIHDPPQLLMDEPFGALDALTRDQLVLDLQGICNERQMTVLFITHSVAEAVFLSDQVVVMTPRPGRVDRVIDIDLPRPRTLAMRETPQFAHYSREILELFLARGVLREH